MGFLHRLKAHLAAIIVLTAPPTEPAVDIGLPLLEPETLEKTVHESGSIGGPVSGRYYTKFCLYHLVSKGIRSSYDNSVPISG